MLQQQGLLCFICGKYFGQELQSHQVDCQKLRDQTILKAQQYLQYFENKEFEQRIADNQLIGPTNEPPLDLNDTELVGKYNDEAAECFSKALIPCVKCNRHFHFERLELHLRNCNAVGHFQKNDSSVLHKDKKNKTEDTSEKKSPRKIRFVICYLCGKNVSLDMIEGHHMKCLEQRGINYNKHPDHTNKLYEGPKPPALHLPTRDDEEDFFERYNQQALVIFYKSPVPCAICGRNFNQRSLEQHMKSCRPRSSPTISVPETENNHSGRRTAPTITVSRKENRVVAAPEAGSLETEDAPKPVTKAASSLSLLKLKRKKRNQHQEEHIEQNRNDAAHYGHPVQPSSPRDNKLHKRPVLKPTLSPSSKIPMLQYRNSAFHSFPKDRFRNEILVPKSQLSQVRDAETWETQHNGTVVDHEEAEQSQETITMEQLQEPKAPLDAELSQLEIESVAPHSFEGMQQDTEAKDEPEEEFVVNHVIHDNLQTSVESMEEENTQESEESEDDVNEDSNRKQLMDVDVTETLVRLPSEPVYVCEEGGTKLPRITHSPSKPTPRRFEVNHALTNAINGIVSTSLGTESAKAFREKSPNPLTEHADRVLRKLEQERGGTPQGMARFCTHCGLKFPGEGPAFRFCGSCGYPRKWK